MVHHPSFVDVSKSYDFRQSSNNNDSNYLKPKRGVKGPSIKQLLFSDASNQDIRDILRDQHKKTHELVLQRRSIAFIKDSKMRGV